VTEEYLTIRDVAGRLKIKLKTVKNKMAKTTDELRKFHKVKLAFPGCRDSGRGGGSQAVNDPNNSLAEALAAIIKPIVKEAVREAINLTLRSSLQATIADKSFLTVKQAAANAGLGVSTVRLLIRRRQLKAQKVGRRVLIKKSDLENFLESQPIRASQD
jgi:excisionase family DNA binding protein